MIKYFVELDGDRVVQIHHSEDQPQDSRFNYVEITKGDFPKFWNPPNPGDYLSYDNGFIWKSSLTRAQIELELEKTNRMKRDQLLQETDWTQLNDIPEETKLKYKNYRQSLRDITIQSEFPIKINWPIKPE